MEKLLAHALSRDPLEAHNISERIELAEANISAFPRAARYNEDLDVYERYVPRTRIILVYWIDVEDIGIVAAFHTSRDPDEKL